MCDAILACRNFGD